MGQTWLNAVIMAFVVVVLLLAGIQAGEHRECREWADTKGYTAEVCGNDQDKQITIETFYEYVWEARE